MAKQVFDSKLSDGTYMSHCPPIPHQSDEKLKLIDGLKSLPWVGEDYLKIPEENKIFFVGESDYGVKEEILELFTRHKIEWWETQKKWPLDIFANLYRALFRTNKIDIQKFWSSVAFYNLIQVPMGTITQRPNEDNYIAGWKMFFPVIDVLKPRICIFIGLSSIKYLKRVLDKKEYRPNGFKFEKIGRNTSLSTELEKEGHKVQLIFIKHTSHHFSRKNWNVYLGDKIPDQIKWLKEERKIIN